MQQEIRMRADIRSQPPKKVNFEQNVKDIYRQRSSTQQLK